MAGCFDSLLQKHSETIKTKNMFYYKKTRKSETITVIKNVNSTIVLVEDPFDESNISLYERKEAEAFLKTYNNAEKLIEAIFKIKGDE